MSLIKKLLVLCLCTLSPLALAGSYQGKITSVFALNGQVYIHVGHGSWDDSHTCTHGYDGFEVWFDPYEEFGKTLLSLAVAAKTNDKVVWVSGNGRCLDGPHGTAERMNGLDLKG